MAEPEITNERAAREWQWLCDQVGSHTVRAAIQTLPGKRRAYPLNIARALHVKLPDESRLPPLFQPATEETIENALARIRKTLGG